MRCNFLQMALIFLLIPYANAVDSIGQGNEAELADSKIIEMAMAQHYASLLFLGQTETMNRTKVEFIDRLYSQGRHYQIASPIFEAVFHAESNCLVKFIGRNVPLTVDRKPDFRISEKRDAVLKAIKDFAFMRFSGLSQHGFEVNDIDPVFDDRSAAVSMQRIAKGIPVFQEKAHFIFASKWEGPKIHMIYSIMTFGKVPNNVTPSIKMEVAAQKAKEAADSCPYALKKKDIKGDKGAAETRASNGQLVFAHPNSALEEEFDYRFMRDSALKLCYVFDIENAGPIVTVYVDAETGVAIGAHRHVE